MIYPQGGITTQTYCGRTRATVVCCRFSSWFADYIDSREMATISDGLKRLFNVCTEFRVIPLVIKAFVDFAFKKIFGSPENSAALIGLLNAILELEHPITDVTILK